MHGLGNLLILPPKLNSKLQHRDPREKADDYVKTGLLVAGEVGEDISAHGWTFKSMDHRASKMLEWAKLEWGD